MSASEYGDAARAAPASASAAAPSFTTRSDVAVHAASGVAASSTAATIDRKLPVRNIVVLRGVGPRSVGERARFVHVARIRAQLHLRLQHARGAGSARLDDVLDG